jgi:hypothetical protein
MDTVVLRKLSATAGPYHLEPFVPKDELPDSEHVIKFTAAINRDLIARLEKIQAVLSVAGIETQWSASKVNTFDELDRYRNLVHKVPALYGSNTRGHFALVFLPAGKLLESATNREDLMPKYSNQWHLEIMVEHKELTATFTCPPDEERWPSTLVKLFGK